MSVERQHGRDDQRDLFDEALLKVLRHGASGDGGTGAGACAQRQALTALEQQRALTQDPMERVAASQQRLISLTDRYLALPTEGNRRGA